MAQARKQRRRTKHRGNAVGMIESRGRTGRKATSAEAAKPKQNALIKRRDRTEPPSLKSAMNRAAISAVLLFGLMLLVFREDVMTAFGLAVVALAIYIPIGYLMDSMLYKRRMARGNSS